MICLWSPRLVKLHIAPVPIYGAGPIEPKFGSRLPPLVWKSQSSLAMGLLASVRRPRHLTPLKPRTIDFAGCDSGRAWRGVDHAHCLAFLSAVAMMVSVGLWPPDEGNRLPSETTTLSRWW